MNPTDITKQMILNIKNTEEFKNLKTTKATIDNNNGLKSKLDDFHKKQMYILQNSRTDYEKQIKMVELNKSFETFSKTPEISAYIKASEAFNKFMEQVNQIITTSINQDLGVK